MSVTLIVAMAAVALMTLALAAIVCVGVAAVPVVLYHALTKQILGLDASPSDEDREQRATWDAMMVPARSPVPTPEADPFPIPRRGDFVDITGTPFHGIVTATHDGDAWCLILHSVATDGRRIYDMKFKPGSARPFPFSQLRIIDRDYEIAFAN